MVPFFVKKKRCEKITRVEKSVADNRKCREHILENKRMMMMTVVVVMVMMLEKKEGGGSVEKF